MAAIALGVLLLIIVGFMVFRGGSTEDDRLTNAVTSAREDPEKLCSSQATFDQIKRDLFNRAAQLRGSDQAAFDKLRSISSLRAEAPLLQDQDDKVGSISCSATITLDLPPGVFVSGGRRSLSADVLYTVQRSTDGGGKNLSLANADDIITALATITQATPSAEENLNEMSAVEPLPGETPPAATDPLAPIPQQPDGAIPGQSTANPSFDCARARSAGEIAVCNDPRLAALDRRMAAQFKSAVADASPEQRMQLNQSRDTFLRYRDQCPSNSCVAETYQGRMREIRDIMRGTWQPH